MAFDPYIKSVMFEGEITFKTVGELISLLDDILPTNAVRLFLNSHGGKISAKILLAAYLEDHQKHIFLTAHHLIGSCAFDLYFEYTGSKEILHNTIGAVHQVTNEICNRGMKNPHSMESLEQWQLQDSLTRQRDQYAKWMSPEQLDLLDTGQDIYLSYPQLEQLPQRQLAYE